MTDQENLLTLIEKYDLSDQKDKILSLVQPSIRLTLTASEAELPVGISKFGGLPDFPADLIWPHHKGKALSFVAQINLAQLADLQNVLPKTGMLYFFYLDTPEGGHLWDLWAWKVLYNENALLKPATTPTRTNEDYQTYKPCMVQFSQEITLPASVESYAAFQAFGFTPDAADDDPMVDNYDSLLSAFKGRGYKHRMFGYPDLIQGDIAWEAEVILHQKNIEKYNYDDPASGVRDWQLLLQVDSDSLTEMTWGDVGTLYYCIKKDDLAQQNFEKIICTMQCT